MCVARFALCPMHASRCARKGGSSAMVLFMQRGYCMKTACFQPAGVSRCRLGLRSTGRRELPSRASVDLSSPSPLSSTAVGYLARRTQRSDRHRQVSEWLR